MARPVAGETYTHERTFTVADVRQFAGVTGDTQDRHTEHDEDGRVLVHGLLTSENDRAEDSPGQEAGEVVLEATVEGVVYRRSRRLPRGLTPGLKPTTHNLYYDLV